MMKAMVASSLLITICDATAFVEFDVLKADTEKSTTARTTKKW